MSDMQPEKITHYLTASSVSVRIHGRINANQLNMWYLNFIFIVACCALSQVRAVCATVDKINSQYPLVIKIKFSLLQSKLFRSPG